MNKEEKIIKIVEHVTHGLEEETISALRLCTDDEIEHIMTAPDGVVQLTIEGIFIIMCFSERLDFDDVPSLELKKSIVYNKLLLMYRNKQINELI